MADFNMAVTALLIKEGGATYTETVGDLGGATKYGISSKSFPTIDIKNLTELQAKSIYRAEYWDRIHGDDIVAQTAAMAVFEAAVNMGVVTASKMAQIAVDAHADGVIGKDTIMAINSMPQYLFECSFKLACIARYAHICTADHSQCKFLLGWINRVLI